MHCFYLSNYIGVIPLVHILYLLECNTFLCKHSYIIPYNLFKVTSQKMRGNNIYYNVVTLDSEGLKLHIFSCNLEDCMIM